MEVIIPKDTPRLKRNVGSDDYRCVNKHNYQSKTHYITKNQVPTSILEVSNANETLVKPMEHRHFRLKAF